MLRLVTIPISHFCEKARWALDRAGQSYREEAHPPIFHVRHVRRAGGRRTVPVLVTPQGTLCESSEIVRWADARSPAAQTLFPPAQRGEIERWLEELDAEFGVDSRLWAYAQVLPHKSMVMRYGVAGAPPWQAHVAGLSYPVLRQLMTRALGISEASVARAEQRLGRLLDRVDAVLADGRPYLLGDRFTAVDLTFAALAAPLVSPPEYHVPLPQPEDVPEHTARRVQAWRNRPAGRHVRRLYREERKARISPAVIG